MRERMQTARAINDAMASISLSLRTGHSTTATLPAAALAEDIRGRAYGAVSGL